MATAAAAPRRSRCREAHAVRRGASTDPAEPTAPRLEWVRGAHTPLSNRHGPLAATASGSSA
eukprot:360508-Chlamydomonas_euryale.AAC.5